MQSFKKLAKKIFSKTSTSPTNILLSLSKIYFHKSWQTELICYETAILRPCWQSSGKCATFLGHVCAHTRGQLKFGLSKIPALLKNSKRAHKSLPQIMGMVRIINNILIIFFPLFFVIGFSLILLAVLAFVPFYIIRTQNKVSPHHF